MVKVQAFDIHCLRNLPSVRAFWPPVDIFLYHGALKLDVARRLTCRHDLVD